MVRTSRKTKQKELMIALIVGMDSFFSADEFFKRVNKKDKYIGIATIYRFLKYMNRSGKVHSYFCGKKIIYSKNKVAHCHFICEKCHQIQHIQVQDLEFLKNKHIGKMCHFQLDVYGVCKSCSIIDN